MSEENEATGPDGPDEAGTAPEGVRLEKERSLALPAHVADIDLGDGSLLAACQDGGIYEVDLDDDSRRELGRHESFASGVHRIPGSGTVVSAGYDGKLKWIEAAGAKVTREVVAHEFWSWQSALSPDGSKLATVTGRYAVGGLDYAPAPESEPSVKVFDVASGALVRALPHVPPVESVAFSRDGRLVAAGNLMGEVRVWDVGDGQEVARISTDSFTGWGVIKGHYYTGGVFALAFAPGDESILLAGMGSTRDPAAGNGKQLWEHFALKDGAPEKSASASDGDIGQGLMETLAWHPTDRFFLMAGRLFKGDWNVALFDASSGTRLHMENSGMRVSKAVFDPAGERVYVAGGTGQSKGDDGTFPEWGRVDVFRVQC
ncbi:hypothetical protein BH23VER1_BH23VER1_35790 [soil metagenome]